MSANISLKRLVRLATLALLLTFPNAITLRAEPRIIRTLGATSHLYRNNKLPQLAPIGSTCTDFRREPFKFSLRLITKGTKAVALVPEGALSGNINGSSATLSSTKTFGEVGVGDWYVIQYVLKLKGIGGSSLQVSYQINTDQPEGSCDISFKGTVQRVN